MKTTLNKENIFWHEIGHYCAQQLNREYFGKYGCEGIVVERVNHNGTIRYKGAATPNKPPEYNPDNKEINHPASVIGSSVYGCLFQTCFTNEPFTACFETEQNDANGFNDYNAVWQIANSRFFLSDQEKDELNEYILDQLEIIRSDIKESGIFNLDISQFIKNDLDATIISAAELDKIFMNFFTLHGKTYRAFVVKLEQLFVGKKDVLSRCK